MCGKMCPTSSTMPCQLSTYAKYYPCKYYTTSPRASSKQLENEGILALNRGFLFVISEHCDLCSCAGQVLKSANFLTNLTLSLLINALLYHYRVDSIKQTYKHGYIYIYKHEHTNQSYIKTNIIIIQLY